jgi:sporulation protein YlmC with PRC-barrel domain
MARDRDRMRRDTAGVGPDPDMTGRLYRLGDAKFKIADGEPDIRGWEVRTLAGNEVGEVDDLLIDPHRGEVVMLDIDLKDSDQHVNIPIRGVQLDRSRKCVVVDSGDIRSARESHVDDVTGEDARLPRDTRVSETRAIDDRTVVDDEPREIRYGRHIEANDTEEVVVERRPVIEEVVVRRRVADADELDKLEDRD